MNDLWLYISVLTPIVLFVAILSFIFSRLEKRNKEKKLESAFAGRDSLDSRAFYEEYFASSDVGRDVVVKIRDILEEESGADLSRLSPGDELAGNLAFLDTFDSLYRVELVSRLEDEFGITISDSEAEKTRTFNDIVTLVGNKLAKSHIK